MNSRRAKQKVTPPELATMWGVGATKILHLIRSGELRAINLATRGCQRPRYVVDLEDVAAFERARAVVPRGEGHATRKLKRRSQTTKDYFPN